MNVESCVDIKQDCAFYFSMPLRSDTGIWREKLNSQPFRQERRYALVIVYGCQNAEHDGMIVRTWLRVQGLVGLVYAWEDPSFKEAAMPYYKDYVFFKDNLDVRFEPVPDGQELTLYDGIYRCTGCGHEKVMREGERINVCEVALAQMLGGSWFVRPR